MTLVNTSKQWNGAGGISVLDVSGPQEDARDDYF